MKQLKHLHNWLKTIDESENPSDMSTEAGHKNKAVLLNNNKHTYQDPGNPGCNNVHPNVPRGPHKKKVKRQILTGSL